MLDKVIENNRVTIIGEVVSDFTYSHEVFGEGFYGFRKTGRCDGGLSWDDYRGYRTVPFL